MSTTTTSQTEDTTTGSATASGQDSTAGPSSPAPSPETPSPSSEEPEAQDTGSDETPDAEADPLRAARREAGRYRRQVRDLEAERDDLRGQVEAMRWSEVERSFAGLRSASPLQAAGYTLEDFTGDDGLIDPATVQQVEARYAEETGLQLKSERQRQVEALGSMDAGKRGSHASGDMSWTKALRGG